MQLYTLGGRCSSGSCPLASSESFFVQLLADVAGSTGKAIELQDENAKLKRQLLALEQADDKEFALLYDYIGTYTESV